MLKLSIESVNFTTRKGNVYTICRVVYKENPFLKGRVFTGVARLHDGDTYDKLKGERIAFAKAERAAYKCAAKTVKRDIAKAEETLGAQKAFYEKAKKCFLHNNEYINELCK